MQAMAGVSCCLPSQKAAASSRGVLKPYAITYLDADCCELQLLGKLDR